MKYKLKDNTIMVFGLPKNILRLKIFSRPNDIEQIIRDKNYLKYLKQIKVLP